MKHISFVLFLVMEVVFACARPMSAQTVTKQSASDQSGSSARAAEIVGQLADAFRAMPSYGVEFEVLVGDNATRGRYAVEGRSYYLTLAEIEVYADATVRYEVENRRREISVNPVDTASRNILSNPVGAFDFLDSNYTAELLWERDDLASVRLTPSPGSDASAGAVTVTLELDPLRPLALAYDYDGELITMRIRSVEPLSVPLKRFGRADYPGYELIDFR